MTTASQSNRRPALYFPPARGAWEPLQAESAGWDTSALEELAAYAGAHNSQAIMLLQRGRIVLERYFNGFGASMVRDVASVQKSVTSFLIGCAVSDGLLAIDDPITMYLGRGWSKASAGDEENILIRHLLTMTSGLTEGLEPVAPPGNLWFYNTIVYQLAFRILTAASDSPIDDYASRRLGSRIGWQQGHFQQRSTLKMADGSPTLGLHLSARDAARFGLLALAGGAWDGEPILSNLAYWHASTSTSQRLNPAYGYLWWLNGKSGYRGLGPNPTLLPGPIISTAPTDLFAARGAGENRIYIVPSRQLVAVRLGDSTTTEVPSPFDEDIWEILSRALPD